MNCLILCVTLCSEKANALILHVVCQKNIHFFWFLPQKTFINHVDTKYTKKCTKNEHNLDEKWTKMYKK